MATDLEALRHAAEAEMARPAPEWPAGPPAKRRRHAGGAPGAAEDGGRSVGRYDYAAARDVRGPGFLVSCAFRREKSAAQEAAAAVREYLQPGGGGGGEAPAVSGCADSLCAAAGPSAAAASPSDAAGQTALRACRGQAAPDAPADVAPAAAGETAAASDDAATPAAAEGSAGAGAAGAADPGAGVQLAAGAAPAAGGQGAAAAGAVHRSAAVRQAGAAAEEREAKDSGCDGSGGGGGKAAFSVVKLGASGLALLQAPGLLPGEATAAVGALLGDIAAGRRTTLEHCRRVVPVEVIAPLEESALAAAAQSAAAAFLGGTASAQLPRPCTYAGAGLDAAGGTLSTGPAAATAAAAAAASKREAAARAQAPQLQQAAAQEADADAGGSSAESGGVSAAGDGGGATAAGARGLDLGRQDAIRVMATAAAAAAEAAGLEAKVDLRRPDWALVAETLPVAGSSGGSCGGALVGLAAVPAAMLTLKPRLQVAATSAAA